MAESRDEKLAFFQACTGIEDVAAAFARLEETNWNLMSAINQVIPENTTQSRSNNSSPDVEMIQEIRHSDRKFETHDVDDSGDDDPIVLVDKNPVPDGQSNLKPSMSKPSTSNYFVEHIRILLTVNGQNSSFVVSSSQTVLDLKKTIHAHTEIPVCRQAVTGWPGPFPKDTDRLKKFSCSQLALHVRDTSADGTTAEDLTNLNRKYKLKIKITSPTNEDTVTLNYCGMKKIRDVKIDVFELSEIHARNQDWTGWPDPMPNDEACLGQIGLNHPEHSLTVAAREPPMQDTTNTKRATSNEESDDSSIEDYEDAPESFGVDLFATKKNSKHLIPPNTEDETVGCLQFVEGFVNRYGPVHPEFFPGNLENAIKEACMKPARERRLLALYLHHDRSIYSNVFCSEILCRESVIQILAAYFILWGWDLTCVANKETFFESFEKELGSMAAVQIRVLPDDKLPAIIIINRVRSGLEIMSVIQGSVTINDLLASLTETMDVFLEQQKVEAVEEDKRSVREMIKMQQDVAFRESLEMDRAKDEARRNQEVADNEEKQREQEQRAEAAAVKEAERLSVESRLPKEPAENAKEVAKIRVRLPNGEFLERRFNETDTLQTLLDWLHVQGFRSSDYKLLSSWPRRDLTAVDASISLKDHKLCPQETVIIEER